MLIIAIVLLAMSFGMLLHVHVKVSRFANPPWKFMSGIAILLILDAAALGFCIEKWLAA